MKLTSVPKWWRSLVRRVPRLSDNRPRFRTLFIGASVGGVETIPWDAVPEGLPSIYSYDRIVVIPATDTNTRQTALRDRLRDDLELAPDTYVQVFWILNEAFAPEIPASIGLGVVTSLQKVQLDSVRTPLPLDIGAVVLGIGKLPRTAIALAHAHIHRTHTSIAVAAMSGDTKWVLIPPVDASAISELRLLIIRPRVVLTAILTALLVLCIGGFHQYRALRTAIADRTGLLWVARPIVELSLWRRPGNSAWSSAANQMALRLLRSYATNLSKLAVNAPPEAEAPERPEPNALARFDVALLAGDTQSAYRLLKDMRFTSWRQEDWAHHTTEILWQRSVESLHEYDFDAASFYVPLYLNSLRIVKRAAKDPGDLEPYRISSLAHIAARELASGRIRSICGTDGVADSFGRLLGRGWGERLPNGDIPGLRAQRARNAAQCAPPLAAAVDYDGIATLDIYFNNDGSIPLLPPPSTLDCTTTPLECEYLDLKTRLRAGRLAQIGGDPFTRTCSYLLDDLVADALTDDTVTPFIAATALDNALSCPEADDNRNLIEGALARLPCTRIRWDEHKFSSIPMQVVAQRCHE